MSKPRDGASTQRQINRSIAEDRDRRAREAAKAIRDKLRLENEKAKLSGEVSRR